MKIGVYKSKNMDNEHTAQLDLGDIQIVIISPKANETNYITNEVKKILRSTGFRDLSKRRKNCDKV